MAIINASDLLVYKKSPADLPEITRVTIKAVPFDTPGSVQVNGYDISGNVTTRGEPFNAAPLSPNTATALLTAIRYGIGQVGAGSSTAIVEDENGDYYIDWTSAYLGDSDPVSITQFTGVLVDDAITYIILQSGQTNDQYEPIAHSTSASVSFNMDLRDTTTKDSGGFQDNEGGLRSFELSTDALQDVNADLDFKEFFDDINSRSEVTVRFSERGGGQKWEGVGIVTSASMDAGVEDNTTYSVSITGTGVATEGTY